MTTQTVEIQILGKTMRVNCPAGQDQALLEAASDFNHRLHELSVRTKVTNIERLLTIAALNVCHELHSERQINTDNNTQMQQRVLFLNEMIDDALLKDHVHGKKKVKVT